MTAGAPADLGARPGNAAQSVRYRRLLSDTDDPGDRVQPFARAPDRQPTAIPALKHVAERIHHDRWQAKLSRKCDRHLTRRTHRDRTDRRGGREKPLHR